MSTAYIGLGANLGDRALQLSDALSLIDGPLCQVTRVSAVYETAPLGPVEAQPPFYNAVAELRCRIDARALLRHALAVEQHLGRSRTVPKGPRIIDIDVLLYGDDVQRWPELELPHPELRRRRFVLAPLLELSPALCDPRDGRALCEALGALSGQSVAVRGELSALADDERVARGGGRGDVPAGAARMRRPCG